MPIAPLQAEAIAADKLVPLQLKASLFVVSRRSLAPTHHIGFAVANGARAGAAYFFQSEKLFHSIGPREGEFVPKGSHREQFQGLRHSFLKAFGLQLKP